MTSGFCSRGTRLLLLLLFVPESLPAAEVSDLAGYDALIKPEQRRLWSFQPVRRPVLPVVKDGSWVRNPLDTFVLAKLEARGWRPAPAAEPRALLRRLYLDLIGLPPTPEEQDDFLTAFTARPQAALETVVDRLLASPRHGERWGRHWLDLVRYADTNGYERDADKPGVWRYRDYVIRTFNSDKPYDRFLLEQLAGDELPDASSETVIATGFARLGPWDDEPADPKTDAFDQLDDIVSTTAQAFLGLTLACARCHNHKFEPLTQHDYYRMAAVFRPLQRPLKGRTELAVPAVPPGQTASKDAPTAYVLQELTPTAPATHILLRGSVNRPGPEVGAGVPSVLAEKQPEFLPPDTRSTRRRLSLARWIASKDNPLTARVLVNRVWQFHFGEGLVRTPSDFGVKGEPPTHPELLDWLADEFVREGWSLKKLHRLILTSNTYRMSTRRNAEYSQTDPENRLLWHVSYRRLEAEAIRDSMLAVSGRLNDTMYGPGMNPAIAREALEGHSDPDQVWKASPEREAARRTVYVHVKRSLLVPLVEVLDFCDTARSTARRNVTTVAPQALALFNGAFVNRQAADLAARLEREAGPDPKRQIDRAFRLALCRPPTEAERATLLAFLRADGNDRTHALEQMCRVILNMNEFVYVD